VQALGGAGQVTELGDRDEAAQLIELPGSASLEPDNHNETGLLHRTMSTVHRLHLWC
jgi:hypothetical protein